MAIERIPSKMRTFRFNDAMEGDLAFLMEMWGCTATDALTRALCSSAALERAYAIYRPASGIPAAPAVPEDTSAPDELPTAVPVEPVASVQTQTAAEIEPTPIIKGVHQTDTLAPAKDTAGSAAASVPAKTKGGNKVRWQFKIYLKGNHSQKPDGAPCGETAEIAIINAKRWLAENGLPDMELRFKDGKHCTTIRF